MKRSQTSDEFEYVFPAIRGQQAGREYYVSMCPLKLIPRIFLFDEEELSPEMRAQRQLNRARVPEMANYILRNKDDYIFSALTAAVDGDAHFVPVGTEGGSAAMGSLRVPMQSRFIINDGQHRRAAIEAALKQDPSLGGETIAVVFFVDRGLARCQQMFADLNRYAVRPSRSLGLLYDHRDTTAKVAKLVAMKSNAFRGLTEMESSSLAARSRKLFTLSAIHSGNRALLGEDEIVDVEKAAATCIEFWDEVAKHIAEWTGVRDNKISAGEVRKEYLHTHSIALQALGAAGRSLKAEYLQSWKKQLEKLKSVRWERTNSELWEGRALSAGRVSKAGQNVALTTNAIKKAIGVALSPEEVRLEKALNARVSRETN